jgi:hypothetical protein
VHPVATKRALRAILKATDLLCFTDRYDYALQALGGHCQGKRPAGSA